MLKCWVADLRKVETNNWRNGLRSFTNLFLVLFPYFLRNVWNDTCAAIQITSDFLQRSFSAICGLARKFCRISSSCIKSSFINLEINRIERLFNRPVRSHQNRLSPPRDVHIPSPYRISWPELASISHELPPSILPQKRPSFPYNTT